MVAAAYAQRTHGPPYALNPMSSVGLVLGGGGITGASYEMAALLAIEMATGWNPNQADVIIGTSAGAYVTALVRNDRLELDSMVKSGETRDEVADRIARHLFVRQPGVKVRSWVRNGLARGVRRPGLTMLLGSPAPFTASGMAEWVRSLVGPPADGWPSRPTIITAFDIAAGHRVAFGTEDAPDVSIADAAAASAAIPLVFRPYEIDGVAYADGGVVSGTHADLILGSDRPLDLVLVLAPMAAEQDRDGARFPEKLFDRVGRTALADELTQIRREWPNTEVLVMRPSPPVLAAMRPNPMDVKGAVPSFIRTLIQMRRTLARDEIWGVLSRHLGAARV